MGVKVKQAHLQSVSPGATVAARDRRPPCWRGMHLEVLRVTLSSQESGFVLLAVMSLAGARRKPEPYFEEGVNLFTKTGNIPFP